jgi:YesN/AraC family two-component response regulator
LSLLYAEDNKNLQQQALKVFTKIFSNVFVCGDAKEGQELFKKHLPEVVITDITMPGINGIEMAKRIKKMEPFTKIIITSAFDDKEHLFGAIDANVSKYLKKPISVSGLVDAIEHVVDEILFEKNKDMFEHYVRDVFQGRRGAYRQQKVSRFFPKRVGRGVQRGFCRFWQTLFETQQLFIQP